MFEPFQKILGRQKQRHPDAEYLFLNAGGTPYTREVLRNRLIRWSRKAGIPSLTPYALRHTFASMQAEAGVNQVVLMHLMGHTNSRTTERYISNTTTFHREAVDARCWEKAKTDPSPKGKKCHQKCHQAATSKMRNRTSSI